MNLVSRHTLWLFLVCAAVPAAHAQESSKVDIPQTHNPYLSAVATLYQQGRFAEALSKLEKALDWTSNGLQEVLWLKLMQGVLQAELSQGEALESFKQALALDKDARLPVQTNRRLRKLFEQARDTLGLPADKELLAQELEQSATAPRVSGPPPRRQGLSVGLRGEVDVFEIGPTTSFRDLPPLLIPAVSASYTQRNFGGVATLLVQPTPGLRAEGQFHPFTFGWVRPYARLGATTFFGEENTQGNTTFLGGVNARAALGMDVQFTSHLSAFADVAYEHLVSGAPRYRPQSLLFSLGMGLIP